MRTFRYITAAVALVALAACNNEEVGTDSYATDPNAVRISATVGGLTSRSNPTDDTKATQFNNGDQIAVQTEDQGIVVYTYNGTDTWSPVGGYLKWNEPSHNFTAYYPADYRGEKTVPADQKTQEAIAAADYMLVNNQSCSQENGVELQLARQTARIVFTIDWKASYENYEVKSITLSDGVTTAIEPYVTPVNNVDTYYALLQPTTADATAEFIQVTIWNGSDDNTSKTMTVTSIPAFKAGCSYTYTLSIGSVVTLGDVKVTDWTGTTIDTSNNNEAAELHYTLDGTTYTVYTAEGLMEVNQVMTSDGANLFSNITLANDITLPPPVAPETSNWTAIGTENNPYKGTFNGNGKRISGIKINSTEIDQGLIGYLGDQGTVQDLTLEKCSITGLQGTGSIVGRNVGGTISGCTISGSSITGNKNVGGIAGMNESVTTTGNVTFTSTIIGCTCINTSVTEIADSEGDGGNIGGIVGNNVGIIRGCNVQGASVTGESKAGGIVGITGSDTHNAEYIITACYAYQCTKNGTDTALDGNPI